MKTALLTGITGQDGAYLARLLLEKGYRVVGGVRRNAQYNCTRLERLGIKDKVNLIDFDLSDHYSIENAIRDVKPDEFYNLAAQSFVGASWSYPLQTSDVNGIGVLRILEVLRRELPTCKFYQASTSEMFGKIQEESQCETTPLYPRSPYGVSKVYSHFLTINYRESYNLFAASGILFNHESPLRGHEFVTRKISSTLARIKSGSDEVLQLGNLNALRDWGFAGDYVLGMWAMLQQDVPQDFVLATGKSTSVREFVRFCAESLDIDLEWSGEGINEVATDVKTSRVIVNISSEFYRPAEVDVLLGNPSKAKSVLNWTAKTGVRELAEMMAKEDLALIRSSS